MENLKSIGIIVLLLCIISGYFFLQKTLDDLAVEKSNNIILTDSVNRQKEVIEKTSKELEEVRKINKIYNDTIVTQQSDYNDLKQKFLYSSSNIDNKTKRKRDLGKLSIAKPKMVQNIINKATIKEFNCIENLTKGDFYDCK